MFLSTYSLEEKLETVNKTNTTSLDQVVTIDVKMTDKLRTKLDIQKIEGTTNNNSVALEYINDISFGLADQVCVSNTTTAVVFTLLAFSSACSLVVAFQLMNTRKKEALEFEGMRKKSLLQN
mmetsp:Transcript_9027/g.13796  ORF Transcript_9027/g.13796 Transcript_9027/m.13796 type:complete len:122 (+) Transcript_9027:107-472(+)